MADGITRIAVEGFKSIAKRQEIEIAPLTILAGANSSGKSSIMQPLLLLKQTLEAPYDPGPLLLDGPELHFTAASQFFSVRSTHSYADKFDVGMTIGATAGFALSFGYEKKSGIQLREVIGRDGEEQYQLSPNMTADQIREIAVRLNRKYHGQPMTRNRYEVLANIGDSGIWELVPNRFLLSLRGEGTTQDGLLFAA